MPARSPGTTTRCAQSFVTKDLKAVRNMRQAFAKGFWRGSMKAGMMTMSGGRTPRKALPTEPDSEQELIRTDRAASFPAP